MTLQQTYANKTRTRIFSALAGLPLLIAAVWFDKPLPWFTILVAAWCGIAILEFYRLVAAAKARPLVAFGLLGTLLIIAVREPVITRALHGLNTGLLAPLALTSVVIISLVLMLRRAGAADAFTGWAWTIAGILYVGWLTSYLVALRGLADGRDWVFFALFITFASDTAAFFVGRALGRHKLAPHISPAKTWEGAIGGLAGAGLVSLLFLLPTPLALPLTWWQAGLLGSIASTAGQLGDLVESLFKRNVGVKDSGNILPGHGGALDRMDSLIFASVVVYYYVLWSAA